MSDSQPISSSTNLSFWLMGVGLVSMTWFVYWPALNYGFVDYDDTLYVMNNPRVPQGVTRENIAWALTTRSVSNWHPLVWMSYMLDVELFGMDPRGFHLTNLALHTANSLLLLWFLNATTRQLWPSAFVSAIFAVHPLHVESVAWVSERKDVLFLFFGQLTLLAYVSFTRTAKWFWYGISLVMFLFSLASKQMLVTMPFLLLLLDEWPLRRTPWRTSAGSAEGEVERGTPSWKRLIAEKVPFLMMAGCVSMLAMSAQSGRLPGSERYPFNIRVMNAILVDGLYLWKTLWPTRLSAIYPHPLDGISRSAVVASGLFLLVVTAVSLTQWRKRPALAVGWFWYLGTLVPVIGLVQIGPQQMADRYMYFPMIGALIAFAWGISSLIPQMWVTRFLARGVAVAVVVVAMVAARQQVSVWKDTESLFTHALAVTENNALAHYSLGLVRNRQGQFDEAMRHFQKSLEIDPENYKAHSDLGVSYYRQGNINEAVRHFERALEIRSTHVSAMLNLGVAYMRTGRLDEAYRLLTRVVEVEPQNAGAHANLGLLMIELGRPAEAIDQLQRAVRLKPDDPRARLKLAELHESSGDLAAALSSYEAVLKIRPQHADAHYRLGALLLQMNERERAVQHLQAAVQCNPGLQPAQQLLRQLRNR